MLVFNNKKHPYTSQASHTSSSESIPQANHSSSSISRVEEDNDSLLQQPVLPWMKSESRNSMQSVDTTSLHVMKRLVPDDLNKKKRWSKHKWWLLLTNTIVTIYKTKKIVDLCNLHKQAVLLWFRDHVVGFINYFQM